MFGLEAIKFSGINGDVVLSLRMWSRYCKWLTWEFL